MPNNMMTPRLAVLIDADNVSHKVADKLFAQVSKLGQLTVRRIYGDFGSNAKGWKAGIARHAIVPQQQFANVPHKNATDITLVIDAMDLMYSAGLDGFCLVASDSDYSRLATRIREQGLLVFGFGKDNAAASFRSACVQYFEIEAGAKKKSASKPPATKPPVAKPPAAKTASAKAIEAKGAATEQSRSMTAVAAPTTDVDVLLLKAMGNLDVGRAWVLVDDVHSEVRGRDPKFSPQLYQAASFAGLVARTGCFELKSEGDVLKMRMRPKEAVASATTSAA